MENEYYLNNQIFISDKPPDIRYFNPIKNAGFKPSGGLWTSTAMKYSNGGLTGWHSFILGNEFWLKSKYKNPNFYRITINKNARILSINKNNFNKLYIYNTNIIGIDGSFKTSFIDYKKLSKEYDIIRFEYDLETKLENNLTELDKGYNFNYSDYMNELDCECSVITNFNVIETIEEIL